MTAPKAITEAELVNFQTDLELLRVTRANLRQLEEVVAARERDLIERLDAGTALESARFTAIVDRSVQRRLTPWKQVARDLWAQLKLDPDLMEARTKDLTEPTTYPRVLITDKRGL